MKVLKFGGTSVGSAERIRKVAGIVTGKGKNIVVLSAMAGTTNTLVEISDYLYKKNVNGAHDIVNALELKYLETIGSLYDKESTKTAATAAIKERFDYLRSLAKANFTVLEEREILAQGEMMSTAMMHLYLQEHGVKSVLLPALEYMRTDSNGEPDTAFLKARLSEMLDEHRDAEIYITQGYICKNVYGETDNLQRGGSDYSASLIGAAVGAEEIEIWTDIDGMHNNDPRYVENTRPVERLNFEEAAELAYFGAKILHPTCVQPAKLNNIPVRLLSTLDPSVKGTLIDNMAADHTIKAVAAKDGITAIRVKSSRMLLAYGFMSKVFEIFEAHKTPIDMVTVSEVGVSVTVDNERNLESIIAELRKFGTVTIDHDMVIICYGGSNCNISFLIRKEDKVAALAKLSEKLFNRQ